MAAVVTYRHNSVDVWPNRGSTVAPHQPVVWTYLQQVVKEWPNRVCYEDNRQMVVANQSVAILALDNDKFDVRETSVPVAISGYYNCTNWYIEQSRGYVGGADLKLYINFPALIALSVVTMLLSLVAPPYWFIFAFVMAGVDLAWFLVFAQHMYVNVYTMPHMLMKLPRLPNHEIKTANGFFELTKEKYQAVFGCQAQTWFNITAPANSKETVYVHVLTDRAVHPMKVVMVYSTISLLVFFVLIIYCLAFALYF